MTEKLKTKLRASEAARVAAVRERDVARGRVQVLARKIDELEAEIRRMKRGDEL